MKYDSLIKAISKCHAASVRRAAWEVNQPFVSRYLVALPKREELQAFVERDRAEIEARIELESSPEGAP